MKRCFVTMALCALLVGSLAPAEAQRLRDTNAGIRPPTRPTRPTGSGQGPPPTGSGSRPSPPPAGSGQGPPAGGSSMRDRVTAGGTVPEGEAPAPSFTRTRPGSGSGGSRPAGGDDDKVRAGTMRPCDQSAFDTAVTDLRACVAGKTDGRTRCDPCKDKMRAVVQEGNRCDNAASENTLKDLQDKWNEACAGTVERPVPDWASPLGESCPKDAQGQECGGRGTCAEDTNTDRMRCTCTAGQGYGNDCGSRSDVEKRSEEKKERLDGARTRATRVNAEKQRCQEGWVLCPKPDVGRENRNLTIAHADVCKPTVAMCIRNATSDRKVGKDLREQRERCAVASTDAFEGEIDGEDGAGGNTGATQRMLRSGFDRFLVGSNSGSGSGSRRPPPPEDRTRKPDSTVCNAMRKPVRECGANQKRCPDASCIAKTGTCPNTDVCTTRGDDADGNDQLCADGGTCASSRAECAKLVPREGCDTGMQACEGRSKVCVEDVSTCETAVGCPTGQEFCGVQRSNGKVVIDTDTKRPKAKCVASGQCSKYSEEPAETTYAEIRPGGGSVSRPASMGDLESVTGTGNSGTCGNTKQSAQKALTWAVDATAGTRTIGSNGCPGYDWSAQTTPNTPAEKSYSFVVPSAPKYCTQTVPVGTSSPVMGPIGVAINGVPIFAPVDANGEDAVVNEGHTMDECEGHAAQGGTYHYHSNPKCIFSETTGQHSPIVGFMADGFPIYGPLGDNGVAPTDLDSCGGHTDATHGFYHYHTSDSYPYTVDCLHGEVDRTKWDRFPASTCTQDNSKNVDLSSLASNQMTTANLHSPANFGTDDGSTAGSTGLEESSTKLRVKRRNSERPAVVLDVSRQNTVVNALDNTKPARVSIGGVLQSEREYGSMRAFVQSGTDMSDIIRFDPEEDVVVGDEGLVTDFMLNEQFDSADECSKALTNMAVYRVENIEDPEEIPQRLQGCTQADGETGECGCRVKLSSFSAYVVVDEVAAEESIEELSSLQTDDPVNPMGAASGTAASLATVFAVILATVLAVLA